MALCLWHIQYSELCSANCYACFDLFFGFCMVPCVYFVYIAVFLSWKFVLPSLWHDASCWDPPRLTYTRNWLVFLITLMLPLMFYCIYQLVLVSVQTPFDTQYEVKWECCLVFCKAWHLLQGIRKHVLECVPPNFNAVCFGSALGHS